MNHCVHNCEEEMEPIEEFRKDYFFLSNFYPVTITYKENKFPTLGAKCTLKADIEKILNCKSPGGAKRLGRRVAIQDNWDTKRVDIMRQLLRDKFCNNPHLKELLTNTGTRKIIEGNLFHDNYWGQCKCAKHQNTPGKNMLGELIMEIRNDLSA